MSKKANPTVIGAFIIGAVVLIAVATALFGGAELFANKTRAVSYFTGSVKGLRVGSNVVARGVRVGYVTDIQLLGDIDTLETTVQVTMELFSDAFQATREGEIIGSVTQSGRSIQNIIDAGLRAQLDIESFVTGQLLVDLDFHPATAPLFRGENPPHVEIPTIPSDIQQFLEGIEGFMSELQKSVDFAEVMRNLGQAIAGADQLLNSDELSNIFAGINELVNARETQALARNLNAALVDLRTMLTDTRAVVNSGGASLGEIRDSLLPVIANLDQALTETQQAMTTVQGQLAPDSQTSFALVDTLTEVQRAARALRALAEYLEQHPEALLRGKDGE